MHGGYGKKLWSLDATEALLHRTSMIRDMPEELLVQRLAQLSKEVNAADLALALEEARTRGVNLSSTVVGD